jgi:hypothetical protein
MIAIEGCAFVIVVAWLVLRLGAGDSASPLRSAERRALVARLLAIAAAAWIGEESCIRLYGFYGYAPPVSDARWTVMLWDVPLAIVCIWPVVVQSSLDVARVLLPEQSERPLARAALVGALVTIDAALIEPISVSAHLWAWTEAGPFAVPLIGVLGWGFFAFGISWVLERRPLAALWAGPLACHALLLVCWWGGLRWLPRGGQTWPLVIGAALLSLLLTARLLRASVPRAAFRVVAMRAPAACFFFVLLALYGWATPSLLPFAMCFAPPWLALLWQSRR